MASPQGVVSGDASDQGLVSFLRPAWRQAGLILFLSLLINLAGNGRISLFDRDEPRYAGCTRAMRETGNYIHPTFNGEPRYHKPVLTYWLMLGGTAVGGDNEFGARLVSAIAGAGTCLVVWGLGRRLFGATVGLMAALMLATAPIFAYNSKLATTDATLALFLTICQFALWELGQRPSLRVALLFWGSFGLATLTKGPIGPVLLAFSAAVSWWWGGPTREAIKNLRWSWGLSLFALITAPWYIAIGILSHGDFYKVSMGYHVLRRMTTGIETHGGFPGYYIALSLLVFYPWSALLPVGILTAWRKRREDARFGFLIGWVVGPLIFLELVRTKLIHYYLPAYPAAALLVAYLVSLVAASEMNLRRWPLGRLGLSLFTGIGIGGTVALLAASLVCGNSLRAPCLVLAVVMGAGTLYGMDRLQAAKTYRAVAGMVATWALVLGLNATWLLPALEPYRLTQITAKRLGEITKRTGAEPLLAGYKPPGIVYEMGRNVPEFSSRDDLVAMVAREGAVAAALSAPELQLLAKDQRLVIENQGTVSGIDIEHAKQTTLHMVVIKPGPPSEGMARLPGQDSQVK